MTGHDYRRYRFTKRTYRNQYLGPFVNHEMNRCIQCYRCVRFYRDYAGGRDLRRLRRARPRLLRPRTRTASWRASSAATWSRSARPASSPTRRCSSHYTRKWDLQTAPSVCVHCGARLQHHPRRALRHAAAHPQPLQRRGQRLLPLRPRPLRLRVRQPASGACAAPRAGTSRHGGSARRRLAAAGGGRAIGIGSPRASLEANFALRRLVGPERFFRGVLASERPPGWT